jgi:hypothetical protein
VKGALYFKTYLVFLRSERLLFVLICIQEKDNFVTFLLQLLNAILSINQCLLVGIYEIWPQFVICILNALLLCGCSCFARVALRAYSVGVDHCYVIVLFAIECNIRPSPASSVFPPSLHHTMHHLLQRCTYSPS